MTISRRELQEYNKSDKSLSLVDFAVKLRGKPEVKKKLTEREQVMLELDNAGIEYKKNIKTSDLKQLLEENK
jgi:Holliday junction resolvase